MSAAASEAKEQNQVAITRKQLDTLVAELESLASGYTAAKSAGFKGMFSSGDHKGDVASIASTAASLIKDIDDTTLIMTSHKLSDKELQSNVVFKGNFH
jgi:molybdenum cofactor biosynthesis enzyme